MAVRYDPYTDKFIDDEEKESITATISLDAFPKNIIQLNVVNVSDDSINKIADAVLQKLRAEQTEPQTMYYPQVDGITPSVIEPQTERAETMSCQECKHYEVGKPCKPFLNECDCHYEPQTDCSWQKGE